MAGGRDRYASSLPHEPGIPNLRRHKEEKCAAPRLVTSRLRSLSRQTNAPKYSLFLRVGYSTHLPPPSIPCYRFHTATPLHPPLRYRRILSLKPLPLAYLTPLPARSQARDGVFLNNMSGHNTIINSLSVNEDNVLVSGGDNGSLCLWDYATGHNFQRIDTIAQPGSLDAEAGIFASSFDVSGSRLVTCEADKTVKIWKEDLQATPETHPIDMVGWAKDYQARKR